MSAADLIIEKLTPVYGPGSVNDLLRFWRDDNPTVPPIASDGDLHGWLVGEVGHDGSVNDLWLEYWTNYSGGGSAPDVPTNLTATVGTLMGRVSLSWDTMSGATAYSLRRNGVVVYNGASTSYNDDGLSDGIEYTYDVRAENGYGNSAYCTEVNATPNPPILPSEAVWWIDSGAGYKPWRGQKIANLGTTGSAINAARGSITSGAYLNAAGDGVVLPASNNNNISCVDSNAHTGMTVLDCVVRVALIDWTPSSESTLCSKHTSASNQRAFVFEVEPGSTGKLKLYISEDGIAWLSATSSVSVGATDGTIKWVRVLATAGGSDGTADFYTSDDGISWSSLGTQQVITGFNTSIFNSTAALQLGQYESQTPGSMTGTLYEVKIWNGDSTGAGTCVADFDASLLRPAIDGKLRYTDAYGNPWVLNTTNDNTNAPLYLPHDGTNNYLYLPGSSNNYLSSPDSAALSITGTLDLIACLQLPDWSNGVNQYVITKGAYTGSDKSYYLLVTDTGYLGVHIYNTADATVNSTVALPFNNGDKKWIRCLVVPGSPDGTAYFYTSNDGSSWTQLGAARTLTGITAIKDSSSNLILGMINNIGNVTGAYHRVQIWNGDSTSGGTKVFDANFSTNTNQSSFTESSSNAATVTINRSTSGRKAAMVTRPIWLFGTDDYLESADHADLDIDASTDEVTVVLLIRVWSTLGAYARFMSKNASTDGWDIYRVSSPFKPSAVLFEVGSADVVEDTSSTGITEGRLEEVGMLLNLSGRLVKTITYNGVVSTGGSTSAVDSTATSTVMRVGSTGTTSSLIDGEVVGGFFIRRALTTTELGNIAAYYGVS